MQTDSSRIASETSQPTILIVDDHPMIVEGYVEEFEEDGWRVVGTAARAKAAERMVARERPDAVLLDFYLPDRNGLESLPRLQEASPKTKIILQSGYWGTQQLRAAWKAGAAGLVDKESSPAAVVELVRRVHETGRPEADVYCRASLGERAVLSDRETGVLRLSAQGLKLSGIAEQLHISTETVRTHLKSARAKLKAATNAEAVAIAVRAGLI